MAKKYYYNGKLYAAKDWDFDFKRPAVKEKASKKDVPEPQAEVFKEDARDGDGDGFVQDGTIFERPVD